MLQPIQFNARWLNTDTGKYMAYDGEKWLEISPDSSLFDSMINRIICGDCLSVLSSIPDDSIDCIVTSPPYYGVRDYHVSGQLGLEPTPEEYIDKLVKIFNELRRVLKPTGTCWLNLGDCYGSGNRKTDKKQSFSENERDLPIEERGKQGFSKQLIGIPWRVALAVREDGWLLRQDIVWEKPNCLPESVKDRCTKSHEYIFFLVKNEQYYFDGDSIKEKSVSYKPKESTYVNDAIRNIQGQMSENGVTRTTEGLNLKSAAEKTGEYRNKRSVWTVPTSSCKEAHFATFPPDLIMPMILAGCPIGGIVLDPFMGSGTTALVAKELNRQFIGIDLSEQYCAIARKRLNEIQPTLFDT